MKQIQKIDCILLAFEDTGSGRNMEVYYKALFQSDSVRPIIAYTNIESYKNAPDWIKNKILYQIPPVDHDTKDCKRAMCTKSKKDHRTYTDWFSDCKTYVKILNDIVSSKSVWVLDSIKPEIEDHIDGPIIQVFHGELFDIGISYYDNIRSFKRYNLILAQGQKTVDYIKKYIGDKKVDNKVKVIGRLLTEELIKTNLNKSDVLHEIGLNPEQKTILFAPSWESRNYWPSKTRESASRDFINFCQFCEDSGFNLIIRPHIILIKHYNVSPYFKKISKRFKNVYFEDTSIYENYNPNKSIKVSDVMITDLSSIAVDFLALNKPVIFMYPNKKILKLYEKPPRLQEVRKVSYVCKNLGELRTTLSMVANSIITKKQYLINQHIRQDKDTKSSLEFKKNIESLANGYSNRWKASKIALVLLRQILRATKGWQIKYYRELQLNPD